MVKYSVLNSNDSRHRMANKRIRKNATIEVRIIVPRSTSYVKYTYSLGRCSSQSLINNLILLKLFKTLNIINENIKEFK